MTHCYTFSKHTHKVNQAKAQPRAMGSNHHTGRTAPSARWKRLAILLLPLLMSVAMPNMTCGQSCPAGYTSYTNGNYDGSSCDYGPINHYSSYAYSQMIFDKGSMCEGYISRIGFYYSGASTTSTTKTNNISVYIGEVDRNQFASTSDWEPLSNMRLVYTGGIVCSATGWIYIPVSDNGSDYHFSGTKNIVIAIVDNSGNRACTQTADKSKYKWQYRYISGSYKFMSYTYYDSFTPGEEAATIRSSNTPRMALCMRCKTCTDRTGEITFTNSTIELLPNQYSTNNNISSDNVSPSGTLKFRSSNTSVAEVDNSGIVHARAYGDAVITAYYEETSPTGPCEYTAEYNVSVTCIHPVFQWSTTSFTANQSTTTFPTLLSNHPGGPITYSSNNTSVASINASTGAITLNNVAGSATITASVPASGDTCSATATYTLTYEKPCTPSFVNVHENYFIRNFTATGGTVDLNNTSLGTSNTYSDYYDFRSFTTNENASTTMDFSITAVGGDTYGAAIWIDYNNDGTFSNGERVWHTSSAQSSPITGSFNIAAYASRNEFRMRVAIDGDNPNPSEPCIFNQGEVEDYKIITPLSTDCNNPTSRSYGGYHIDTVITTGGDFNIENRQTHDPFNAHPYTDFSPDHYVSADAGSQITVQATFNSSTSTYGYLGIWVDWNNDGTFDNATERMYISGDPASGSTSFTLRGTFLIPSWAQPGEYRMRLLGTILLSYFDYPCGNSSVSGEYEDYRIVVTNPTLTYTNGTLCSGAFTNISPATQQGYGDITLSSQVPSCSDGTTFAGWNTMPDGSGEYFQPSGTYHLTHDATIYAIFLPDCCVPDSAILQYTHGGKTDTARMADDGYFYYNICQGETMTASIQNTSTCTYSNPSWLLDSIGNQLATSSASSISHTFNHEYGYNLYLTANSTAGCELSTKGRVRVSGGIHSVRVSTDNIVSCPDNIKPVTIGYDGSNSFVEVNHPGVHIESTLGHAQTIFLPDGVECDPDGDGISSCSYISSVNFTQFSDEAVVRDYNDILYLHMNMEHTYIGDLYIALRCPDGNTVTILNFGGNDNAECASEIPAGHLNWTGSSGGSGYGSHGGYMGNPDWQNDVSSNLCSSALNPPGTGWNYIWSNNDNRGYTYAGGEQGYIYNQANMHSYAINNGHSTVDSSDLANMSQIYHPEESFAGLVGCHLKGEWKIIVIDGFKEDNGYLFEWNLALNEDLLPENWTYSVALDTAWAACNWSGGGAKFNNFTVQRFSGGPVNCTMHYTDEYGCETTDNITLNFVIEELEATATHTNATCGSNNGQISITPTSGVAPYYYSLNGGAEQVVSSFTGLAIGDYSVRVRDSRDCYIDIDVEIENETSLTLSGLSNDTICAGKSVSLNPTATGGTTPYTWTLNGSTVTTWPQTVTPGSTTDYTVVVTGADDCAVSKTITVVVNPKPTVSAGDDQAFCSGSSGVSLTASASGGTTPYASYAWSPADGLSATNTATVTATPTANTTYTVIVTDNKGCKDTDVVVVNVGTTPTFTYTPTDKKCKGGDDDGTIKIESSEVQPAPLEQDSSFP